jgi:hypothetical protein
MLRCGVERPTSTQTRYLRVFIASVRLETDYLLKALFTVVSQNTTKLKSSLPR